MKKLSKAQAQEWSDLIKKVNEAKDDLDGAWGRVESAVEDANTEVTKYNDALGAAAAFRDEIVGEMDDYMSERSDKWQEGEAGEAYSAWKDEWEGLDLDEIADIDIPDQPEPAHGD